MFFFLMILFIFGRVWFYVFMSMVSVSLNFTLNEYGYVFMSMVLKIQKWVEVSHPIKTYKSFMLKFLVGSNINLLCKLSLGHIVLSLSRKTHPSYGLIWFHNFVNFLFLNVDLHNDI